MTNNLNIFRYFKDPTTIIMMADEDILAGSVVCTNPDWEQGGPVYTASVTGDTDCYGVEREDERPYAPVIIGVAKNSATDGDKLHVKVCGIFKVRINGHCEQGNHLKLSKMGGTVEMCSPGDEDSFAIAIDKSTKEYKDISGPNYRHWIYSGCEGDMPYQEFLKSTGRLREEDHHRANIVRAVFLKNGMPSGMCQR